jgi:hypothetical protein
VDETVEISPHLLLNLPINNPLTYRGRAPEMGSNGMGSL